jgi:hypothetical protein
VGGTCFLVRGRERFAIALRLCAPSPITQGVRRLKFIHERGPQRTARLQHIRHGFKGAPTRYRKITEAQAAEWSKDTVEEWANESHAIAVKVIYHDVPESATPAKMDQTEVDKDAKIIDDQLQRGGARLAVILNRVFK